MRPEAIEAALEQPEFNNPLMALAKARIALEGAMTNYDYVIGDFCFLEPEEALELLDEREMDFFEDMAGPFGETAGHEDSPADIIKNYYTGIKTTLLSPQHRLKEAIS